MSEYSIIKAPSLYLKLTLFCITYILNLKSLLYCHPVFLTMTTWKCKTGKHNNCRDMKKPCFPQEQKQRKCRKYVENVENVEPKNYVLSSPNIFR